MKRVERPLLSGSVLDREEHLGPVIAMAYAEEVLFQVLTWSWGLPCSKALSLVLFERNS